jgi:1,4-alpha-glucan branching enzyme
VSVAEQVKPMTLLSEDDIYLFNEGTHYALYDKLGAHLVESDGVAGTHFAVWAPNASAVSVVGDWNGWQPGRHRLEPHGSSGIWEGFIPGLQEGALYKYHVESRYGGYRVDKADPFGVQHEAPPRTASIVRRVDHTWRDQEWMATRRDRHRLDAPMSIYEVHLGSWRRVPEEGGRPLTYREIAPLLADHVAGLGFTHVELMPVMEHPFTGSWGYQVTGYFAATSRYGSPSDLMAMIDELHCRGIGVILDWVPSHFPSDEHGLAYFDGTHLYEHADPKLGFHPDWESLIFNYGRNEVRSFLVSSALWWLERFHADALRVDAVASMLYLDYSRRAGEWVPNKFGGRENLDAIDFLRHLNAEIYRRHPDVQTIAEESTAWPMTSRPTYVGGLGFGYKWDMGWMHDTLAYLRSDPIYRRYEHHKLTFRALYQFTENYVLPLSHDEVVHGKGSLLGKMPGDTWQRFANLRLLYATMWAQPGKKLLFMGGELGQYAEWDHDSSLDWHLLDDALHRGVSTLLRDLNRLHRDEPALRVYDCDPRGFAWLDANDADHSVYSFVRRSTDPLDDVVVVVNATPVPRTNYQVGVPRDGYWREVLNTDAPVYGGSGQGNLGGVEAAPIPYHAHFFSLMLSLPPLSVIMLRLDRLGGAGDAGDAGDPGNAADPGAD